MTQSSPPCFAVLLVPDFSLQALLRIRPELTDQPIALLDGDRRHATVIALTARARDAGVELGLTVPQALARCRELVVQHVNTGADDEANASLLAAAATLAPLVEHTAAGIATIDVTALPCAQRQPRLAAALARLATLGLTATAGLAPTPLLAQYAARAANGGSAKNEASSDPYPETEELPFHPPPPAGAGVVDPGLHSTAAGGDKRRPYPFPTQPSPGEHAPVDDPGPDPATGLRKSRLLVVTNARAFLAPLPLAAADPDPAHVEILRLWGISTLGQLTALAKADVAQRLGPGGLALWERAAGESIRPLQPLPPPRSFAAELELEHLIESLEPLLFLLRRFVDRLCLDLQGVALAAAELDLSLRLEDDTHHQRSIRLPQPTASPDLLFRTLQSHLETVTTDTPIVAIRLEFFPTRPLHRQQDLFDTGLRDPHGFAETLARVAALLGSDQVGTPRPSPTYRPDSVLLAAPATGETLAPLPPAPLPACGIPLRRFRPPWPAQVELRPGSRIPIFLHTDHVRGEITDHHGPWRANGDWWQSDQAWAREEWDIALGSPPTGLYRLSHTPTGWYLDGEYD